MAGSETHYTLPLPSFDKPVKLLIVVAPYYKDIADNLVAGARAVGAACGAGGFLGAAASFFGAGAGAVVFAFGCAMFATLPLPWCCGCPPRPSWGRGGSASSSS